MRWNASAGILAAALTAWPVSGFAEDDFQAWKAADAIAPMAIPADKGWVGDAAGSQLTGMQVLGAEVTGRLPGPRGEIVGYARRFEPEATAAFEAARRSAAAQLRALVLFQLAGKGPFLKVDGGTLVGLADIDEALEPLIRGELEGLVKARFEQSVERPYGAVYRTALLVKADRGTVERLRSAAMKALHADIRRSLASRGEVLRWVTAALGLALAALVFYSVLNAVTRGHFAWALRVLSAGGLTALYLGIAYLKGWFS